MKLNNDDKKLLLDWGYTENDFEQIEEAFRKRKTTYEMNNSPISREKALEVLGRRWYLSGIARSAFHRTAVREAVNGQLVYFDSSNLFSKG